MHKTMQRTAILKLLKSKPKHLTADQIYNALIKKVPQLSLGTVYRNLEQMAQAGLISRVKSCSKQKQFEGNTQFHLHVRCPICDTIEDVYSDLESIDNLLNSKFEDYILEFTQVCQDCKEKIEKARALVAAKPKPLSLYSIDED